jgi:uncharacterized protein (DUF697 family)
MLKKASFLRKREFSALILMGFAGGQNNFAESISASFTQYAGRGRLARATSRHVVRAYVSMAGGLAANRLAGFHIVRQVIRL